MTSLLPAAAASVTTLSRLFDCVTAALHEHVSNSPPGFTSDIAHVFTCTYLGNDVQGDIFDGVIGRGHRLWLMGVGRALSKGP